MQIVIASDDKGNYVVNITGNDKVGETPEKIAKAYKALIQELNTPDSEPQDIGEEEIAFKVDEAWRERKRRRRGE